MPPGMGRSVCARVFDHVVEGVGYAVGLVCERSAGRDAGWLFVCRAAAGVRLSDSVLM